MIGILNAYHFDFTPGNYQEHYNKDIMSYLARTFPGEFIHHYKIAKGEWPTSYDECAVWVITGSSKGAYDDVPWIHQLQEWIRQLHARQQKMIGICFGHQVIAQALGGKVENSAKGWGVGVRTFTVKKAQPWMQPPQAKVSLLFSHQDQVVILPTGAVHLAEDEFCPHQMFQIGHHILALQGHPEFSVEFAKMRLESRKEKMPAAIYTKALESMTHFRDDAVVSQWMREFAKYE